MYKKTNLENGIRIITNRMPGMQSVALGVWIKVGGRHESADNKGVGHYLEHLTFKGTRKYSLRELKESIEGVGGSLNGFTSEELTCYLVKIPSRHLPLALDILSDMVINPLIPEEEVEKERTVILEEIKMYKDQPHSFVYDLLDELLWPGHPLGMSISGTPESVSRLKREDIASFQKKYYTPSNIIVSAAGLLGHEKLAAAAGKIFSHLEVKNMNTFLEAKEEQAKPQLKIFHKDTEQTHLALGFHSFRRDHPLRHALGLLHVILGGNMSSRLFNEVREKRGLAYEIGTHVKRFQDTGSFIVHAGIDNRKVEEAIRVILEELGRVRDALASEDEFKRAREFYTGQLTLALEDTLDTMLWIGESTATLDKTYALDEILAQVKKVKRQDVQRVAKTIFEEKNINLALIGPLKEREESLYKCIT
jgi:predicted Zn-dependent peptidase